MKKVLSIVLSLVLVICMMPVMAFAGTNDAAYNDIAGEKCEGAVNVLSALGVVDGYENGTYKPEQTVTRAEMAKLVITALGMDSYATATKSSYSDMALAQWAIPYVEYATNLGIIEGVGGGRFSPGNPVTYEQAVTMIVRALGYTTDCNEMNGTWPAVYVQKATALGIFKNVEGNQYGTGANRGDVAIMLYNALDIPQVYADKDGETHYKKGEFNSATDEYDMITMMSILNKDGDSKYQVVTSQMADNAVTDIREYIGAAAKVTTDKNDDVIAVGDIKTTFLTGKVSNDGKKFTVGDTEYTLPADTDGYVDVDENTGAKVKNTADKADQITNGETAKKDGATLGAKEKATIAAKVSGKTIKEIYSVAKWDITKDDMVSDSQINMIKSKQTLLGQEFALNDDREIDMASFELIGVDSLDKIEKDDVVYVYTAPTSKKITRVAVGQKTVTGKVTKITDKNKYTIDGTVYELVKDVDNSDIDTIDAGDAVTVSLDAYGDIYKLEADSANGSYAVALKADKTSAYGEDTYMLQFLNAAGEVVTAKVDSDYNGDFVKAMDEFDGKKDSKLKPCKASKTVIVEYHLNSSDEIDSIAICDTGTPVQKKKVTNAGYYDSYELANNVVIFSYNGVDYSKADNYTVVEREDAIGKEFKASYTTEDGKIVLMVANDLVASDVVYGLVTGSGNNDSDAGHYVTVLEPNGEANDYNCSKATLDEIVGFGNNALIGFKYSSNNEIKSVNVVKVDTGVETTLGGDKVLKQEGEVSNIENGRITLKANTSTSYGFSKDVVVYKLDGEEYKTDGDISDILEPTTNPAVAGSTIAMFDIEGEDGVYDVIVILK